MVSASLVSFGGVLVDNFDVNQVAVPTGGATGQAGEMLGGQRKLQVVSDSGTPNASATVALGQLTLASTGGGQATLSVVWDGLDATATNVAATGLGTLDLTSGGDDAFLLGINSTDTATSLTLTVYTDATHSSQVAINVAAGSAPNFIRVPFNTFTGTANFAQVGAIKLATTLASAATVNVDFLRTTSTTDTQPVEARLTDVVLVDTDHDGHASAGDTLRYTVTVRNTGASTLSGVSIALETPAHTTATGSLISTPLAHAVAPSSTSTAPGDPFHATLDTTYTRSAANGLLSGSYLGSPAATITSFGGGDLGGSVADHVAGTTATSDGHSITVNADGSLSYTPKSGFTGLFTFQYRITNSAGTSTATATLAVGVRPQAVADAYAATGNVPITKAAAQGVLSGAGADGGNQISVVGFGATTLTATFAPGTANVHSAQGGDVSMAADGGFTYTPPVGFTGTDTFAYKIDNGFSQPSTATVTVTVSNLVWFIDGSVGTSGNGRYATPFKTFAAYTSSGVAKGNNSVVYVFAGSYSSAAITLLSGQQLIGQGADLSVSGITFAAGSPAMPTATSAPTLSNAATIVTLPGSNAGSTIRSVNLSPSAGFAIAGNGAGTTSVRSVTIVASGSGGGVSLTNQSGAFTATTMPFSGPSTGVAVLVSGGSGNLNFDSASTIAQTGAARAIDVQNRTGGTVAFASTISSSGSGRGIYLASNTGSVDFSGKLTLTTGATDAFTATNAGTVSAVASGNVITTTTGRGVYVSGTTIGSAGLTFQSVTSGTVASGPVNGILLSGTGSGSFTITGSGTAGTGGTIQKTSGDAISLTNTGPVSLAFLTVQDNAGSGVAGASVNGFSLVNSTVLRNGGTSRDGTKAGLFFGTLTGTCTVSNCTIQDSPEDQVRLAPSSGTLVLTVSNCTIGRTTTPASGGNGLTLNETGTANVTLSVTGSTFAKNYGTAILTAGENTAVQAVKVWTSTFTDNYAGIDLSHGGAGAFSFSIKNNTTFLRQTMDAIRIGTSASSVNTVAVNGAIFGNIIGDSTADSGSAEGRGINLDFRGAADGVVSVTNNNVQHTDIDGFHFQGRLLSTTSPSQTGRIDLTYTNNLVGTLDNNTATPFTTLYGTLIEARDNWIVNLDMSGNTSASYGGVEPFRVRQREASTSTTTAASTFGLLSFGGTGTNTSSVASYLSGRNNSASFSVTVYTTFSSVSSLRTLNLPVGF